MQDHFVCIARRGHPAIQAALQSAGLDLALFLELDHLLVSPEGDRHGLVDQALAYLGKRRRVALSLPQMFAAPTIVAHSDMVCTVMKRVASHSPHRSQLDQFPVPVSLPVIAYDQMWHRRNDDHPAQRWLREQIAELAASL